MRPILAIIAILPLVLLAQSTGAGKRKPTLTLSAGGLPEGSFRPVQPPERRLRPRLAAPQNGFRARAVLPAIAIAFCQVVFAQSAQERLSFEVASVKANVVDDPNTDFAPRRSGNRITMHNAPLGTIIAWAYHLTNAEYQLVAPPNETHIWGDDYDIQALAPGSPDDDLRMMFQTLLEDRFQLKVHREKRELTAYDLVVAKGGPKLVAAPSRDFKPGLGLGGISSWAEFRSDGKHLVGKGASVAEMAIALTTQMRAPVVDRTGIAGIYDFDVPFSTGVDGLDKPVPATAIHDLGLNLQKSKGTFELLVIDHFEKPGTN